MKAWTERLPAITEAEFTAQVLEVAHLYRWRVAHFRPARTARGWRTSVQGDGAGFPDLIGCRGRRIFVAELKRDATKRPSPAQVDWLADFRASGVETYVWVPDDFDAIAEVLR